MRVPCLGCGAEFEPVDGPTHRYMLSSPACWVRYGELIGLLAIRPELAVARQYCTDAYAVQHPGEPTAQAIQSIAVHLLNLHGYIERGVRVGPPRFAGHKGAFHWLTPPTARFERTVRDIPLDTSDPRFEVATREWAESAWRAWAPHHAQIAAWYRAFGTT